MTKAELITTIATQTGLEREEVRRVLEQFIRLVKAKVAQGEIVHLRRFGRFAPKRRARKIARNLNQNTALVVEAHHIPSFKPSDSFATAVKKLAIDPNA